MPWIPWLAEKSLFFTTKNNKENIYNFLNNCLQDSVSGLSNNLNYSFLSLKNIIIVLWIPPPKIIPLYHGLQMLRHYVKLNLHFNEYKLF